MASDNEACCESDPNFAVICAFMEKFGTTCGLQSIDFLELQEMLENTQEVHQELIDLHIKLFRKSRKTISSERWERAVIKFCHTFCVQDAWEIERFGYKKARLSSKLRVLKELLEMQFDFNTRFKAEINKMSAEELRSQPIGRDKHGHAYWFQNDNNCQIRVYKDDQDEETWTLVAKDRDGLVSLINELDDGDSKVSSESAINEEDSNSLAEKPIIDTGQVDSSSESNKKLSGDSENSNESSSKKEEDSNISGDVQSDEEVEEKQESEEMEQTSTKRSREDDDEDREAKKSKIEESVEVGEAIEEPLMVITGEGDGEANKGDNPIVGEEIEEDLMFFCGAGNGEDCETGNEEKPGDGQTNQSGKSGERDTGDSGLVSISSEPKNRVNDEVPTPPAVVKSPYKLGTIIDTKTDNKFFSSSSTVNKNPKRSRWDVETILTAPQETGRVKQLVNKWEQQQQQSETREEAPKKAMFFFGPGCLQYKPATVAFGQKVPPEMDKQGDVGYRIEEDNKGETSDCVQSGPSGRLDSQNEHPTPIDKLENDSDNVSAADAETKVEEISKGEERIPEVTAALVGYRDDRVKESEKMKRPVEDPPVNLVPVVEEVCIKKHAYLLGDEAVENHRKDTETVIQNEDLTVEDESKPAEVENVSKIDENENKRVMEQVPKESSLGELSKSDDRKVSKTDAMSSKCEREDNETSTVMSKLDDEVSKRDNKLGVELSMSDDVVSNCETDLTENTEVSKCDEKVGPALSTSDPTVGATLSKCNEKVETPKFSEDAIEISESEDIAVSKSEDAEKICDDIEITMSKIHDEGSLEVSKVPKARDEVEVSKTADIEEVASKSNNQVGVCDKAEIALTKGDDVAKAVGDKVSVVWSASKDGKGDIDVTEDIGTSKPNDAAENLVSGCADKPDITVSEPLDFATKKAVALPTKSDDVAERLTSGYDRNTDSRSRDIPRPKPVDKVDVALATRSDDGAEDLTSKCVGDKKVDVPASKAVPKDIDRSKSDGKEESLADEEVESDNEVEKKVDEKDIDVKTVDKDKAEVGKVTAVAGILNLSRSNAVERPEMAKAVNSVGLDLSKRSDQQPIEASKLSDIGKSVDKVAQESIDVSKQEEQPSEITKASKSVDRLREHRHISKSKLRDTSDETKIVGTDEIERKDLKEIADKIDAEEKMGTIKDPQKVVDRVESKTSSEAEKEKSATKLEEIVSKPVEKRAVKVPMREDPPKVVDKVESKASSEAEKERSATKVEEVVSKPVEKRTPKVLMKEDLPKVVDKVETKTSSEPEKDRSATKVEEIVSKPVEKRAPKVPVREDPPKVVDKVESKTSGEPEKEKSATKVEEVVSKPVEKHTPKVLMKEDPPKVVDKVESKTSNEPEKERSATKVEEIVSKPVEKRAPRVPMREDPPKVVDKVESKTSSEPEKERSATKMEEIVSKPVEKRAPKVPMKEDPPKVVDKVESKTSNEPEKERSATKVEEIVSKSAEKRAPKVPMKEDPPKVVDRVESKTSSEPEKERSATKVEEIVSKPAEKRALKVPIREVRRQTRRSAQLAKTESVDKEEQPLETESTPTVDPVKEPIKVEAKKGPDRTEIVPKEAVVICVRAEDQIRIPEKPPTQQKEEPPKVPAKRGRKNNSSEQNPEDEKKARVTRRSTRSSKNTESVEESAVEEKPAEVQSSAKPRRGRPRGGPRAAKDETNDESSKKMKLSNEEPEVKRSLRSSQKEEQKDEGKEKESQDEKVEVKDGVKEEDDKVGVKENEEKVEVKEDDEKVEVKEDDKKVEVKEDDNKVEVKEVTDAEVLEEEVGSPMSSTGSTRDVEPLCEESDNGSDVVEVAVDDPLAVEQTEEEEPKTASKPLSLSTFSLDFTESPNASPLPAPPLTRRGLRKRGRESPHEEIEETAGKRQKMKAKRAVDVKLRKSIEEQKKKDLISSDDDSKSEQAKRNDEEEAVVVSSDDEKDAEPKKKKNRKNKNQRLLSNLGIDPEQAMGLAHEQPVVRQSRRIAQLKIREEAERRKLEDELTHHETHKKKKKKSKKSDDKDYIEKHKSKQEVEDEDGVEEDSTDSKKKDKKKKKRQYRKFDELNPWRSSSDSSSSNEEEDVGEEEEEEYEDVLQYVSDHEFSPESDMEGDGEVQPLKRARTARKESDVEEEVDDCPCQKCGKSDHPEWILLCDSCDNGWHCSCLRPALLVIPEGDWFCPPCQHAVLLKRLQKKLQEYDKKLHKKALEDRRKQRLAYVGISLNSVLPTKDTDNVKKRRRPTRDDDAEVGDEASSSDESDSGSGSGSESGSDSDEPIYQLRQRRQAHSYRFNDFDDLINSAIQDEMDAVKGAGNQGRGKDIATIVNAEKEEERKKEAEMEQEAAPDDEDVAAACEPLPPVVPLSDKDKEARPMFEPEDDAIQVKKKIIGRKKHRKLNALDISSAEDDADSDEDFKGTSSESDDDFDDDLGSEDSDDLVGGRRRKGADPVRRSTRARTSRYDADFIDDGESYSEDDAPKRKKKRSIWDDSESEESDRSWGRTKRKPPASRSKRPSNTTKKNKSKKKKKKRQDSDEEVYKKKKPKIKFGLDDDDDGPVRRTRGKKINYVDALGSDTDEERIKRPPPRIDSDEEYVASEDEMAEDEKLSKAESGEDNPVPKAPPAIQIQSYTDARFTQLLPEPKNILQEDLETELNPIDQINRNVEMMDENEMEKMMEEEEYANKQLQMVAQQLEKEKRRKEREAKKLEGAVPPNPMSQLLQHEQKKRARKPKDQFQFSGPIQEPLVGNVDNLLLNSENNDELSEPPGVSLPLFAELGGPGESPEDTTKKRRGKTKKTLEEAVANLGSARQHDAVPPFMSIGGKSHPTDLSMPQESNIEIAAPPQPFSQSQPTPSVITRMLQSKPGQAGYPVGTIRPKQFATMPADDDHSMTPSPTGTLPGQYVQGAAGMRSQLSSPYRQMAPSINHFSRTAPPPQMRAPVPHMYHTHRPMDPSPSGGGAINMADHNSPGRVVSPAAGSPGGNKNETPPPPYSRPPPGAAPPSRFPMSSPGSRHIQQMVHLQPNRPPNLSPYHPGMPPQYHYGQFGQEDALPPPMYQGSPYSEAAFEGQLNPSENSNSKGFEDESGGEFGGLVSYFSSQREDDLES